MSEWQMDECPYLVPMKILIIRSRYIERLIKKAVEEAIYEACEL